MKFLKFYENLENLEKNVFFRDSRFPVRSVFVYKCIVVYFRRLCTIKMDYEENMENAHYATNDETQTPL